MLDIFLPYALWSVLYFFNYNGSGNLDINSLKLFIKQLVLGNASYHLWYIAMVFQFYLLIPVYLFLFKRFKPFLDSLKNTLLLVAILVGLYYILMWFSIYFIPAGFFRPDSYLVEKLFVKYRSLRSLFYSFYFFMGGIVAFYLVKWRRFVEKSELWNFILVLLLFFWVGVELLQGLKEGVVDLNRSTSLKPSMFFYTVVSIILIYKLSLLTLKHNPFIARVLTFIGKYSFGAYLIHAFALTFSVRFLMPYFHYSNYP